MRQAVITGVGVVSPFGLGWERWVKGLREGVSATRTVSLFDPQNPYPCEGEPAKPLVCQVAGEVPDFEPHRFLNSKDSDRVPRVVPLALAATTEALKRAGWGDMSESEKADFAVVLGSGGGGFSFGEEQFARWFGAQNGALSPYAISSTIAGMISSEISIAFGLRGRSHTFSDGCTSSSDALGNALDLIRNGRCSKILCGGADAPITPGTLYAFSLMRAVPSKWNDAPAQASRPFAANRDGFVLGEGAWMFVVEEKQSALQRGAKIWAEIAGYGSTCEAFHRVALGAPDEAARAMQLALQDADCAPDAVDAVNLHGTGTQLNDPLETAAVKLALGKRAFQIPMSATKSQIGHPQGASSAAGVASALATLKEGFFAPTINLDNPAPECDLDYTPHHSRTLSASTILCNCLGFGSKNAALVLRSGMDG